MKDIKFYIGPMSKNIVDSVIEYSINNNINIGLIPSRRQIDKNGGYVNNWTTKEFSFYVKNKSKNILLVRDHCGPNQGQIEDDGVDSFIEDCSYFDVIHIDVWKKYPTYEEGLSKTIDFINLGYKLNSNLYYEIGTEEAIRKFESFELDNLVSDLNKNLSNELFSRIKFLVIQSGTALKENTNIGIYDKERLTKMLKICKKYNLISKEHNGDYISNDILKEKFILGLNSINIAPEFGQIETNVLLEEINSLNRNDLLDDFFQICLKSNKWKKWVSNDFDPLNNKLELINICGHYVFSSEEFLIIKHQLSKDIDDKIKISIKRRIEELQFYTSKK
jgi:hypothetical protein